MDEGGTCCPVCTLYLREGITLQAHLETHPKDKVIEALLKVTNGGQAAVQTAPPPPSNPGSMAAETLVPAQQYVAPNAAFISQTQNFVNPQTQVTAAVTYQQFVTSNGSTVMPQYIQVPTIVAPNSSVPMIPSQPINYVPNQPNAYAHTMYNPLYNPYIPQPYPLVQPMYASMPVAQDANTQVSTSQVVSPVTPTSSSQTSVIGKTDSVLKEVSSVATNTSSNRDVTVKVKTRRLPLRSSTQAKFRIIKQLGSRLKTTTSTMATVATKSFKITSINSKTNATAKTSVITKARSFKTKNRPLLPKPSPSAATTRIISPPPLTPMTRSRSGSVSCSKTPPPPPLSKAPCLTPLSSSSFDLPSVVKTEKAAPESGEPEAKDCEVSNVAEYILDHHEVGPSVSSVIVESNSAIQITSNIVMSSHDTCLEESRPAFDGKSILPRIAGIGSGSSACEESSNLAESGTCESFEVEAEQCEEVDRASSYDDEELPEKVFHSFEFEEEKKVAFNFDLGNQDIPKEITSENIDKNCDGSDIFIQQESIPFTEESRREKAAGQAEDAETSVVPFQGDAVTPGANSAKKAPAPVVCTLKPSSERAREVGSFADLKSLTYTDLQPATNSKVLQDLGIPPSFDINNFMEVDGIKIFFNNANVQNVPLEPIIKFTSNLRADARKVQHFMKSESEVRENDTIVESVIHLVSGTGQKSDYQAEALANSSSHLSDGHADLRDLSPLTLNIRADESMPARGELSEQESLGAENSNWGLFQSEASDSKTPEMLRPEVEAPVTVPNRTEPKTFKCALCPEVFTSLRERRLHRSAAHDKPPGPPRKPKVFECIYCKDKFNSLRDRRRHVIQSHYVDVSKVKKIKQEEEVKAESVPRSEQGREITMVGVTIKQEEDEATVKSEEAADGESKAPFAVAKNCPDCELSFAGPKKLREHMKKVHGLSSRYKCGTCSETFSTDRDYNSHLRIHPLECSQCGKLFSRKPNLKLHLRRHLVVKPYVCPQCPKSFITRQKLDEHMNGHSGNKPLKCTLCDRTFSRHSNLIQHRNIHHSKGKKKVKDYVCRCGEVFHSSRKLEWHKEVHDTKPKTCPFCSQKFIHSNSVTRHIRRSHIPHYLPRDQKDNGNVQCPVCGKIYLRSSLIVHMRVHNGEKPFVCKICNKRFTTKWNLELHNWTHQSRNNMPFKCTICKSAFFREVDYSAHINSHRNYRPFTCNICGQKFIRKYNCLRHQEEHKREKKFVCTVSGCEKSFHRSYYLRDHMTVHTGFRPHTCHICGKASSTKSNHNKHVRIHDTREPLNTEN